MDLTRYVSYFSSYPFPYEPAVSITVEFEKESLLTSLNSELSDVLTSTFNKYKTIIVKILYTFFSNFTLYKLEEVSIIILRVSNYTLIYKNSKKREDFIMSIDVNTIRRLLLK